MIKLAPIGLLVLAGCGTIQSGITTVKVPVPIVCQAEEPRRPVMPSDSLTQADSQDTKVAAVLAELDIREGYEGELREALRSCKK